MKKFKKILNLEKTIALTSGVLVLSGAIAFIVIAWTGPTAEPPLGNAPAPLNTGDTAQVKTGDLTVGNLSLDDGTGKGDINNAEDIIGGNDLFLHSGATNKSEILLDENGAEGIKFYTNGAETMVVGGDGNVYISNLNSCDTIDTDASGKLVCGVDKGNDDFGPIYRDTFFWDPPNQGFGPGARIYKYFVLPVDLHDFYVAVIGVIVPRVYPHKDCLYYGYEVLSHGNDRVIKVYLENVSTNIFVFLQIGNTPWTILYTKEATGW